MAYTKIIVIRGRLDKCLRYAANEEKTYLETAVDYALDRDKTERVCFETAINCGRDTAYEDMTQTARRWGKQNRVRKGYHVIQSFRPGEVTPEQAHAIGAELAQRALGGQYEVVVATHLDRTHLHNHVVFNAVSFRCTGIAFGITMRASGVCRMPYAGSGGCPSLSRARTPHPKGSTGRSSGVRLRCGMWCAGTWTRLSAGRLAMESSCGSCGVWATR